MADSYLLNTYPTPLARFIRGEGVYLYDSEGKKYLDFLAGIAVVSLGHANQEIAEVITDQAHTLTHVSNYFDNEYKEKVAEKINNLVGLDVGKVFYANSGAEANECAIKIAKRYGKGERYKIATALSSFHGRTIATLAATGQKEKHEKFLPLPDYFSHFDRTSIDSLIDSLTDEHVAVMIEVIQGEGGVRPFEQDVLRQVQEICRERDLVFIIDEIQTGICRTGPWCAFQHYGLAPDIVTFAKALGNGFPVGTCWATERVADVIEIGDHGSTYGGQPLALRVVDTVLTIMERDNLTTHVEETGNLLRNALRQNPALVDVRGMGLLIGFDLDPSLGISAGEFVARCMEHGLVVNATGPTTIRLAPPLIINQSHIDEAMSVINEVTKVAK